MIIYTSYNCGYCDLAKKLLNEKGISFKEINIQVEIEKRDEMLQKSNGRRTVPQIFYKDLHIGGYQELKKLDLSGELDNILDG
mgnify:FL=1